MNSKDLFGLGLFIIMVSAACLYVSNGESFFHYSSIIYFLVFVGCVMTTKAFYDALVSNTKGELDA